MTDRQKKYPEHKSREQLEAEVDRWRNEYLNASQDAMNFARKLNELEAQGKIPDETLEHAWQRICYGKVDYDVNEPVSNLMRMFDYPRYTWDQLHDLIKGIKR